MRARCHAVAEVHEEGQNHWGASAASVELGWVDFIQGLGIGVTLLVLLTMGNTSSSTQVAPFPPPLYSAASSSEGAPDALPRPEAEE